MNRATAAAYATWFRALGDPTRILILNLLARKRRPMSVSEIVAAVDVGQSTVSHHLAVLADAGFVLADRRGASTFFTVNERCIDRFPSAAELVMGRVERPRSRRATAVPPWVEAAS